MKQQALMPGYLLMKLLLNDFQYIFTLVSLGEWLILWMHFIHFNEEAHNANIDPIIDILQSTQARRCDKVNNSSF